jgi:hypothetical protein
MYSIADFGQKVATEKPCYICKRPTVVVLATIDTKDYLYTCESHLSDSYVFPHLNTRADDLVACKLDIQDVK